MKRIMTWTLSLLFALAITACGGVEPEDGESGTYTNGSEGVAVPATAEGEAQGEVVGEADQTEENNEGGGGDQNSARAGDDTCDTIEDCDGVVTKVRLYAD